MLRRSSLTLRGCAIVMFLLRAEWAGLTACTSSGTASPAEAGHVADATMAEAAGMKPEAAGAMGEAAGATAEASCAVDAGALDDATVAFGQQLVTLHKCASCHGSSLSGNFDGVPSATAEGGTAYPPNLTPDPATGLGCWTNDQIVNAILNGIDNEGMPLCPPMPRWGHIDGGLDLTQAQAVVEYLRSLAAASSQVPNTPNCPELEAGEDASEDASVDATRDAAGDAAGDAGEASPDSGGDAAADARGD